MKKLLLIPLLLGCWSDTQEEESSNVLGVDCFSEKAELTNCQAENLSCRSDRLATKIKELAFFMKVGDCWHDGASCAYHEEDKEKRKECLYYIRDCYVDAWEKTLHTKEELKDE